MPDPSVFQHDFKSKQPFKKHIQPYAVQDLQDSDFVLIENGDFGPWNEGSRIPVEDWLAPHQSEQDRLRLACMGNIVVPVQAKMAVSLIAKVRSAAGADAGLNPSG